MKTAGVKWAGGMRFVGLADSGHAIVMDAARENGGQDSGPRPSELTLIALAGCTGVDIVNILTKMRITFEALEIAVEAEAAADYPKVWTEIRVTYKIRGDVPEDKLRKAIKLSHEKYCSVGAMLGATARMSFAHEIVPPATRP
jgi:putative redox protein